MAGTVTFGGTRFSSADAATNWGNYNASGPAPAAEPQLRYQGTNAVNKKITSTTSRQGVDYDPGTGGVDLSSSGLAVMKAYVSDFGDLNTTWGVEFVVGDSSTVNRTYNVAGSGANNDVFASYPAAGGYLIVAINPRISAWAEATNGSPSFTSTDYFGFAAQFQSGAAKSENFAADAIDIGTGLTVTGGTGGSPATFSDFVTADQNTSTNRWGFVNGNTSAPIVRGMLQLGTSGTAVTFDDQSSQVQFVDGYHGAGDVGVTADLQNASSTIDIGATLTSLGRTVSSVNTRAGFVATGTSGTGTFSGSIVNFNDVTFNSAWTVTGSIECQDLTQGGANMDGATILTNAATGVACCNDADFAKLEGATFIQSGDGHAIEITSPGTYTLTDITFSGYGADASNAAAIYNNSGGSVTINVTGGSTPTVRNGAGASTTVNNTVNLTFTGIVSNSRLYIYAESGGPLAAGTEIYKQLVTADPLVIAYSFTSNQPIRYRVRKASGAPYYQTFESTGTITSSGFSVVVQQTLDQ